MPSACSDVLGVGQAATADKQEADGGSLTRREESDDA